MAMERMRVDPRDEPKYGERVPYDLQSRYPVKCLRSGSYVVHARGLGKQTIAERSIEVSTLLRSDRFVLDANYYIEKKIIPPLERIFNLVGANVRQWYYEMPKYHPPRKGDAQTGGPLTLDGWLAWGASTCAVCQRGMSSGRSKLRARSAVQH